MRLFKGGISMDCVTVRNGQDCLFMAKKGCSYNGGVCLEIVEKCDGCARTIEYGSGRYCTSTPSPSLKWRAGNCNLATHVSSAKVEKKVKVNPLKASKRSK